MQTGVLVLLVRVLSDLEPVFIYVSSLVKTVNKLDFLTKPVNGFNE